MFYWVWPVIILWTYCNNCYACVVKYMVVISLDLPSCGVCLFDPRSGDCIGTLPDRPRIVPFEVCLNRCCLYGDGQCIWAGIIQVVLPHVAYQDQRGWRQRGCCLWDWGCGGKRDYRGEGWVLLGGEPPAMTERWHATGGGCMRRRSIGRRTRWSSSCWQGCPEDQWAVLWKPTVQWGRCGCRCIWLH